MPNPLNISNIPAPRVEFIDPRTGLMAREWYRFFFNLFNLTGNGSNDTSLSDLQVGPPPINQLLGELGIVYDQAQLAAMMAQYEQSVHDLQNQLETAPAQPQLGTLSVYNEDNVRLIGFDTNPSPAVPNPAPTGTLYWDGNSTLGLQMDAGVLAKVAQSQFTYVKASSAITKGQLVKHTGSVGGSGVITVAPTTIGMLDANEIVGVAAESIALNAFGFIQDSGDLRGFDTTGTSVGEVWADGDPLYYNPAYVGALTNVKPLAPNLKSYVGEVINASSGGSGSIHVRMSPGSVLGGTDSNVQFGALSDKDLIQYDSVAGYWKNVTASSVSIGTATNLAGGVAGSVPYQTGASATTFLPIGTAGQYAKVNAGATAPEWASPAALTEVDDTNITLTLGGSASTALLNPASITVGWTGTLAVARGGTGASTASITSFNNITGYTATGATGTTSTNLVFSGSPTIATPTVTTSATIPLVIGGTGTTSTLALRSTSGVGTTGADIIFQTGNNGATEAMRVLNSGNVGIGTNSPVSIGASITTVDVSGANGGGIRFHRTSATASDSYISAISGEFTLGSISAIPVTLRTTNLERVRIDASGNVGIGTATPSNLLSVQGNANVTGNITLGNASTNTVTVNGYMGVGVAAAVTSAIYVRNTALTGTTQTGVNSNLVGTSGATSSIRGFSSTPETAAATFTVTNLVGYWAANAVLGAGSTITNQHGVYVFDQTQGTNNYGITSLVSSGSNKWNIYASGTAANHFAGNVGIGTTTNLSTLTINGSFASKSPSTVNAATYSVAATDGSLRFTTTNNTLTLPAAASFPGRILYLNTITANSVTSAASNVIPLGSDIAGTAILAATAGKFAMLQSNGTNWITMLAN